MATQCEGAPMEEVFSKLQHQEGIHLARLKEAYEKFYMSGMQFPFGVIDRRTGYSWT